MFLKVLAYYPRRIRFLGLHFLVDRICRNVFVLCIEQNISIYLYIYLARLAIISYRLHYKKLRKSHSAVLTKSQLSFLEYIISTEQHNFDNDVSKIVSLLLITNLKKIETMLARQLASQTNNANNKYQQQILPSLVVYNSTRVKLTDQNISLEKVTRPSCKIH